MDKNKRCLLDSDYMIHFFLLALDTYSLIGLTTALYVHFICLFFILFYHIVLNNYYSYLFIFVILLHFLASCTEIFQCAYLFTGVLVLRVNPAASVSPVDGRALLQSVKKPLTY